MILIITCDVEDNSWNYL